MTETYEDIAVCRTHCATHLETRLSIHRQATLSTQRLCTAARQLPSAWTTERIRHRLHDKSSQLRLAFTRRLHLRSAARRFQRCTNHKHQLLKAVAVWRKSQWESTRRGGGIGHTGARRRAPTRQSQTACSITPRLRLFFSWCLSQRRKLNWQATCMVLILRRAMWLKHSLP